MVSGMQNRLLPDQARRCITAQRLVTTSLALAALLGLNACEHTGTASDLSGADRVIDAEQSGRALSTEDARLRVAFLQSQPGKVAMSGYPYVLIDVLEPASR